tara:strand:+ start:342 stop:1376 length:1035 start_codon:yes stop_codon:yes gene_type:complete
MFNSLLQLYKTHTHKTPFEDFNTECFAGVLRLFPEVKDDFIENVLRAPKDDYKVVTQLRRSLENDQNCIIDLAFIGKESVCLVENKVESLEGTEQLSRYSKVLDFHYKNHKKYLFYCTKYSEPKNLNAEYDTYNFIQFKWYEIAEFLKKYRNENPIIQNYLDFLKKHKMEQDNTIKVENLLTMENLLKTVEIANFHINNSKDDFNKTFKGLGSFENTNKNFNWTQLNRHNRFCNFKKNVLISKSGKWSEINYMISFNQLSISTCISLEKNHEQFESFKLLDLNNSDFELSQISDWGIGIFKSNPIGDFLNDENSDKSIKEWFVQSFIEIIEIKNDSNLIWNNKK